MTVRKLGGATIEKVEEICGPGFKPARMFPRFNQEAFDKFTEAFRYNGPERFPPSALEPGT